MAMPLNGTVGGTLKYQIISS